MPQMKEGKALSDPDTTYYDELEDQLELVLTFTEQGVQHFLSE
jgi:THO complex subunit 1